MIEMNTKILSKDQLVTRIKEIRSAGGRVGFTNGCFDILHLGHIRYLRKAGKECDVLVVGVNSDRSVRALKGAERPLNKEAARAEVLAELACVGLVAIFAEDTPIELIKAIMPDVLFKGGDWKEEDIVGSREVKNSGGRVMVVSFEEGYSTTGLISRLRSAEGK